MKTKELIRGLFESDSFSGAKRLEALVKLQKKLKKKQAKLEAKLLDEGTEEDKQRLRRKLEVNSVHQLKAQELLDEVP